MLQRPLTLSGSMAISIAYTEWELRETFGDYCNKHIKISSVMLGLMIVTLLGSVCYVAFIRVLFLCRNILPSSNLFSINKTRMKRILGIVYDFCTWRHAYNAKKSAITVNSEKIFCV